MRAQRETTIPQLDPLNIVVRAVGFLLAISVHEFSHAFAALRLGDPTAKNMGRLTLNPLRHLDPFGALLLLIAGFGWGKPVPVNGNALRYGRLGMAIVSVAGPFSNFIMAVLTALVVRGLVVADVQVSRTVLEFLFLLILLNLGLCVFNLLPIAPLDGFGVAVGVLPWSIARPISRLGQYGPGILLILLFSQSIIHLDILGTLIGVPTRFLLAPLMRVAGLA